MLAERGGFVYIKECPKCGEYTYSASKKIWKCQTCGNHIDEVEVEKLNGEIEDNLERKYRPDWADVD